MLQGKKTSENHRLKGNKKVVLIFLLDAEPMMRIVVPPSHRYQALLAVFAHGYWRVQHTMQQVKKIFYWPQNVHVAREKVNLKNVEPFKECAKNINDVLCVGPLTLSTNKNKYILTVLD